LTQRVAITGMSIVDTLGSTLDVCWQKMVDPNVIAPVMYENCKIGKYKTLPVFPVDQNSFYLPEEVKSNQTKYFERSVKYGLYTLDQALKQSGVEHSSNVAVVASNITAGNEQKIDLYPILYSESERFSPKRLLGFSKDFLCGLIAQQWEFKGPNVSLAAACATGQFNIDYAMKLTDSYDYVVCTCSDGGINETDIAFFSRLHALGTHSSPFDRSRNGFVMGEGAGTLILESEANAKKRGANVLAWIYPVGFGTDTSSPTSPDSDGLGGIKAMTKAIGDIDKNKIAFVNAHGTSTPVGDRIEYEAISTVLPNTPIWSCKSKIGHTMGACGIIETVYSVQALNSTVIPDNWNLNDCEFDNNGSVLGKNRNTQDKQFAVNNSFGFGGKCASILIERNNEKS